MVRCLACGCGCDGIGSGGWGFVGVGDFGEGVAEVVGEVRGEEAEEHVGLTRCSRWLVTDEDLTLDRAPTSCRLSNVSDVSAADMATS